MKRHFLLVIILAFGCTSKTTETAVNTDPVTTDTAASEYIATGNAETDSTVTEANKENANDGICACNVSAYLNDPDTEGTNIRETPKGKITGQLHYDADCECLTVDFTGSKDGWMRLSDGGWVHGKLFSIDTRNYGPGQKIYLQADPTEESEVVATFDTEKSFKVRGCCGSWIQVEDGSGTVGWLTGEMICANPLTNCS